MYDSDSLEFGEFVRQRMLALDKAWGDALYGCHIGNPLEHGKVYELRGGEERARIDRAGGRRYKRLVDSRGSEQNHILRETDELRELLQVRPEQLPAFAVRTFPPRPKCLVLRIQPKWLATSASRVALNQALQACLADKRVSALVTPGRTTTLQLEKGFQRLLNEIPAQMTAATLAGTPTHRGGSKGITLESVARKHLLVIDEARHRVLYKRKEIRLTELPFQLHLALAREATKGPGWVRRTTLEDVLWPRTTDSEDYPERRRLDDVMGQIRAAYLKSHGVSKAQIHKLFLAQRHVGYRIDLPSDQIRLL